MVTNLVWLIVGDSPNLLNFVPTKLSCYMVYSVLFLMYIYIRLLVDVTITVFGKMFDCYIRVYYS